MNKRYILKSNEDIAKLVAGRESVGNRYYAIYYKKSDTTKKLVAVSVSKKLGSSPLRNKEKRRVREILRKECLSELTGFNILVVVKSNSLELSFEDKEKILKQLVGKITKFNKGE